MHPHHHGLEIFGTKATFRNEHDRGILFESRDPRGTPKLIEEPYPGVEKGAMLAAFVEAILSDATPPVTADDVLQTMAICFAIERATKSGQVEKVNYL